MLRSRLMQSIRRFSSSTPSAPEAYPTAMKAIHWGMATGLGGCVMFVKIAQSYNFKGNTAEDKANIGYYMRLHKTFGLMMAFLILPRLLVRRGSTLPAPVVGAAWEHLLAKIGHYSLYGFMLFLPVTGITMGIFGGKGLPFFSYTIPGLSKPVPSVAKLAFKTHTSAGKIFPYVAATHVGAVGYHRAAQG